MSLRKRGRHVQIGLLLGDDDQPPIPMAAVIAAGALAPQRLIRNRISLDEVPAALAGLDQRDVDGVTMITISRR